MELEQWLRHDMKRFIADKEFHENNPPPVRHEDTAQLQQQDYVQKIDSALENDRYEEATRIFAEIKKRFEQLPENHIEERKHYYRDLQRAYGRIYEYVADKHKTMRILREQGHRQDVFDPNMQPVDLSKEQQAEARPPPTIEELMTRKEPQPLRMPPPPPLPKKMPQAEAFPRIPDQPVPPPVPQPEPEQAAPAEAEPTLVLPEPPVEEPNLVMPAPPEEEPDLLTPPPVEEEPVFRMPEPPVEQAREAPEDEENIAEEPSVADILDKPHKHERGQYEPDWGDDLFADEKEAAPDIQEEAPAEEASEDPEQEKPEPLTITQEARRASAKELARRAQQALGRGDDDEARSLVLEARFELARTDGDPDTERRIHDVEARLAAKDRPREERKDAEFFSTAYLKGLSAMQAGDYNAAARLFEKRVAQTPYDRAARIRLAECMEVLNGRGS